MQNMIIKTFKLVTVAVILSLSSYAQDSLKTNSGSNQWSFLIEPYLMLPNMNGATGIGNLPEVAVDADPGDIFSNLQMAAMLYMEASNDKWSVNSDVIYMDLSQDAEPGDVIVSGEVSAKQFAWEITGLRKVFPWLEVGVAGMLNSLSTEVVILVNDGPLGSPKSGEVSETWVDPMIVARVQSAKDKKFIYHLRGDVGGFGIGSDLTWQIQAYAGYRFSKLFQLTAGYRVIGIDYENGSGQDKFVYDVNTFGPVVRIGFNIN